MTQTHDSPDTFTRVHYLATAMLHGDGTNAEAAELEQLVLGDDAALAEYVSYIESYQSLHTWAGEVGDGQREAESQESHEVDQVADEVAAVESSVFAPQPLAHQRRFSMATRHLISGIAVAITFLAMSLSMMHQIILPVRVAEEKSGEDRKSKKNAKAVARLVYAVNTNWRDGSVAIPEKKGTRRIKAGVDLVAGEMLRLTSGVAEIKFFGGGEVVLEGPAEFEIQTGARGRLELGRLTARAPVLRAKGFIIDTPSAEIEDLGTEFGVNVDRRGSVEVSVFDGKVVARPAADGGVALELGANQTALVASGATHAELVESRYKYVSLIRYPTKDPTTTQLDVRSAYSEAIKDAKPVSYWRLSQAEDDVVRNEMADRNHARRNAGVDSPDDPTRFDGASTYFEVDREIGDNFSLELWVRSKQPSETGQLAWLGSTLVTTEIPGLADDFTFSVLNNRAAFMEGPTETDTLGRRRIVDGSWHHVVLVRQRGKPDGLRIYVDGKLDASAATNDKTLDENRQMLIGASPEAKRFFNGWIDEAAVYDRVLSGEEIATHYALIAKPRVEYFSPDAGEADKKDTASR